MKHLYGSLVLATLLSNAAHGTGEIILRNADGSVKYMFQPQAKTACPQNMHLPTAREFAQRFHPKGILEIENVNPGEGVPMKFSKISAINTHRQKDIFYYSYKGFKPLEGDMGAHWFWSASDSANSYDAAYFFSGDSGLILEEYNDDNKIAVLCIPNA